ncbi:MAG: DUF429 domain-containing protein [Actinomycetota bacterium]|nr:DUF429 domain-containing protein [Actinomycetota bacterium]
MTGPRFVGLDLAWGERARTGIAVLDADGRLDRSTSVRTDDEIAEFLGDYATDRGIVAAIDAPLIVPNESGSRRCEKEITAAFGRFHAGAYPSNRGRPQFVPEPRAARLARRFGWNVDPETPVTAHVALALEVYPHPAMVTLLGLPRVLPYKGKGRRTVASRQAAFTELRDRMEQHVGALLHLGAHARWAHIRSEVATATRPVDLDRVEDEVDAIWCAYLAWAWVHDRGMLHVYGDATEGYIVAPLPPSA